MTAKRAATLCLGTACAALTVGVGKRVAIAGTGDTERRTLAAAKRVAISVAIAKRVAIAVVLTLAVANRTAAHHRRTSCGTKRCGAVGVAPVTIAEVAAAEAVAHAVVAIVVTHGGTVVTAAIPRAAAVHVPGMSATIFYIKRRSSEEEVIAVRIACVDAEVPVACVPVERTKEVGCITERAILPREQYVAEVEAAALPVGAVEVVDGAHTHQVVEVYLVGCLILCISKIEFIRHLIGEEQCLLTCLLITHCTCRYCHDQQCCKG